MNDLKLKVNIYKKKLNHCDNMFDAYKYNKKIERYEKMLKYDAFIGGNSVNNDSTKYSEIMELFKKVDNSKNKEELLQKITNIYNSMKNKEQYPNIKHSLNLY